MKRKPPYFLSGDTDQLSNPCLCFSGTEQKHVSIIYTRFEIRKINPCSNIFSPSFLLLAKPHVNILPYVMPYANRFEESFLLLIIEERAFIGHFVFTPFHIYLHAFPWHRFSRDVCCLARRSGRITSVSGS